MAKGITIQVAGLSEIKKKLGSLPQNVKNEADAKLRAAADKYVDLAVNAAPVDQSALRQGISAKKVGELSYEVVSAAPYSAYIEFGTRRKAKIPADLQQVAARFKGKSGRGDYYDFLNSILDWVKRKGIVSRYSVKTRKEIRKYTKDDNERLVEAAQAIAISIMRNGIKPQPFFYQHRAVVFEELKKEMDGILKQALKK